MKRWTVFALLCAALFLVACEKAKSPTEPWRDEFDKYFVEVTVFNEDSTRPMQGARGTVEDMFTNQKVQFRTDDIGSSEKMLWEGDPRRAGVRVIIEPGSAGGISYDKFEKILTPRCVPDISNVDWGICRVNVELVDNGIG